MRWPSPTKVNPATCACLPPVSHLSPKGSCSITYLLFLLYLSFSFSRPILSAFTLFRSLPFPPMITTSPPSPLLPCQMSSNSWENQLFPFPISISLLWNLWNMGLISHLQKSVLRQVTETSFQEGQWICFSPLLPWSLCSIWHNWPLFCWNSL